MAVPYNFTNLANQTSFDGIVTAINTDFTGGMFGIILLGTTFVILMISFKGFQGDKAFAGATFITTVFATFLNIVGLIPGWIFILCLFALAGSTAFLWKKERG